MLNAASAFLGGHLQLTLSGSGAVLQHASTAWQRQPATVARLQWDDDPTDDPDRLAMHCGPLLEKGRFRGLPLRVTLSDEQVRLFMVTPPNNATTPQDLRASATARFHGLYGDGAHEWQLAFDGDAGKPFLACGMSLARIAALGHLARTNGLCLASVTPLFVEVWNRARARLGGAWLGLLEGRTMTLAALSSTDGGLRALHRQAVPEQGGDMVWLRQQVTRFALREGVSMPARMQLYRQRELATVEAGGRLRFRIASEQPAETVPPKSGRRTRPQLGRRSKSP